MYSRKEIHQQLDEMEVKLVTILDQNTSDKPPYTPDYANFDFNIRDLLLPIMEYCDDEFHKGNVTETNLFSRSQKIIAAQKYDLEKQLKTIEEDDPNAIKLLGKFKLLCHYFTQGSKSGMKSVLELADLEYRREQEENLDKQTELFEETLKIHDDSSTGDYLRAKLAMDNGDLEEALKYVNRGIEKLPENTPLYILRSDIYQRMSEQSINDGIKIEPRDTTLQSEQKILNELNMLRGKISAGEISEDEFFTSYDSYLQEQYKNLDLNNYNKIVESNLTRSNALLTNVRHFLATGEYLLEKIPDALDHAPTAIEFCKALEVDLKESIFVLFKNHSGRAVSLDSPTRRESFLFNYCAGTGELTLGNMAYVLQILNPNASYGSDQVLKKFKSFIQSEVGLTTFNNLKAALTQNKINRYRNGAAHTSAFSKIKAEETRQWCYSIINLL